MVFGIERLFIEIIVEFRVFRRGVRMVIILFGVVRVLKREAV